MNEITDAALAFTDAGCSVVPAMADGSKAPAGKWQRWQAERPDTAQVRQWLSNGHYDGFGVICGAVSGGLEMLELEGRAVATGVHIAYRDALASHGLSELWQRIVNGYAETTPSGGLHFLYRVDGKARGNTRLAVTAAGEPLIETRGEGGFTITAPSAGRTHPTGKPWRLSRGGPATIATITADERDALHAIASLLTQAAPRQPATPPADSGSQAGDRPGDDYSARASWQDILTPHGWQCARAFGPGAQGWRRPGKETPGISATTREDAGLYVFSTSTPFDSETPYSKFAAYALLNHGGDYAAAAGQLRREGYGAPREHDDADIGDLIDTGTAEPPAMTSATSATTAIPARRLVLTPASEIEPEPVVWAWEEDGHGRIPAGMLGLFAGREGTGKSSFLIWLTAKITTGTLPGALTSPRAVIYLATEDSWKYTIAPRLIAAGADLNLVYRAEIQVVDGGTVSISLPVDNEMLEAAITGYKVAMVAIDPLMSVISGGIDTHVNREVRQALDPLAGIADRTGAVIAGIAHFSKARGLDASSLITGSGAFKDVARFIFAFATDQDGTQVITQTKNSVGLADLPSFAYRIVEAIVETPKGIACVGRLIFDGTSERTVQDILSDQGRDLDAKSSAENYLRKVLADGPKLTSEVEEGAQHAGFSKRTLERARKDLKVVPRKVGDVWWIALPEHEGDLAAKTAKDAKVGGVGGDVNSANSANSVPQGEVGGVGGVDVCTKCGEHPAGPGGVLCPGCKETLSRKATS